MKYFDLTKDGTDEIMLGREDGRVEVYSQDNNIDNKIQLAFSKDIGGYIYICSYLCVCKYLCVHTSVYINMY